MYDSDTYETETWDDGDYDYYPDEEAALEPCPNCGKDIYEDSEQCPFCGEYVTFDHGYAAVWSGRPLIWIVLALLGIIAVITVYTL